MLAGEELQAHCPTALRIGQRKSILAFGMANFSFEALWAYEFRIFSLKGLCLFKLKMQKNFSVSINHLERVVSKVYL